MHDLHFLVFVGEFYAFFVQSVERDKRGLWKPPSSTTWSWAGDCDPSKCGGCARSRSRSHVDRLRAISRLDIFFFLSRVRPTTMEAAVARGERFLHYISRSLHISFPAFSPSIAIYDVEHFHRILFRSAEKSNALFRLWELPALLYDLPR